MGAAEAGSAATILRVGNRVALTQSYTLSTFRRLTQGREPVLKKRLDQVAPVWQRRASWLALVSLAWMQLAFAGHQFEHSAAYADSCDACVQLDRLDDVVAESLDAPGALRPVTREAMPWSAAPVGILVVPAFNPRAPPVI